MATRKTPRSLTACCAASIKIFAASREIAATSGKILMVRSKKTLLCVRFFGCSGGAICHERLVRFDITPCTPIAGHHFVGFARAPASGRIVWKIARWECLPDIKHGLDYAPPSLHHVRALEERCVTNHAVIKKALIACAVACAEVTRVIEIHVYESKFHHRTWNFRAESQRNAFFRLNVNHKPVRTRIFDWCFAE